MEPKPPQPVQNRLFIKELIMMGLLQRVRDVMSASVNDILNRAENPEKMLNLYIERATEEIAALEKQVTNAMADGLFLKGKLNQAIRDLKRCTESAQDAVRMGRDDLARTAIAQQKLYTVTVDQLTAQDEEHTAAVKELNETLSALKVKLSQAKVERDNLVMRHRRADALHKASESIAGFGGTALADFDRMREKVERVEARSRAYASQAVLPRPEDDLAVEAELARLKAELGR